MQAFFNALWEEQLAEMLIDLPDTSFKSPHKPGCSRGQKFRQVEPQCTSLRGFIFHPSLQNIIYDSMTTTSCWWCHTWLFTSFLPPEFQLQEILHCSERQEDVKKHVLWLITPQTCWEHRHYVIPDRALSHWDISSFSFVSSAKWIGRLLCYSFSVRRAVSSFATAIWGKQTLGPKQDDVTGKEHWQGHGGLY